MEKVKGIDISAMRQKIYLLNRERGKLIFKLLRSRPMVYGMPHEVFRKCGKKNCKCTRGELHGPYVALAINKDGKQKNVMVKKADLIVILQQASRYRDYQETLAKIRKINKQINELLEKVKSKNTRSYP